MMITGIGTPSIQSRQPFPTVDLHCPVDEETGRAANRFLTALPY